MAAQKGIDFTLKEGAVSSPTTITGVRTIGMSLNNEQVDVTTQTSANAMTLLAAAGVTSYTVTVAGLFEDAVIEKTIYDYAAANTINTFSLFYPNGDTMEASFAISDFSYSGEYNGAQGFEMTLQSSGAVTYTAA
tara:strand:+ start:1642 stop:2046 length:405 start_codon:yes stop_codon:yes gene_type:complete